MIDFHSSWFILIQFNSSQINNIGPLRTWLNVFEWFSKVLKVIEYFRILVLCKIKCLWFKSMMCCVMLINSCFVKNSSFSFCVYHIFLGSDQVARPQAPPHQRSTQRRSASSSASLLNSSKIMMQTAESSGFLSTRGHTFGSAEEANEPPPTLSRLPPDGHEFPPDYRDPAASTIFQVNKTEIIAKKMYFWQLMLPCQSLFCTNCKID